MADVERTPRTPASRAGGAAARPLGDAAASPEPPASLRARAPVSARTVPGGSPEPPSARTRPGDAPGVGALRAAARLLGGETPRARLARLDVRSELRTNATPRSGDQYLALVGREDEILSATTEPPPAAAPDEPAPERRAVSVRRPTPPSAKTWEDGPASPPRPQTAAGRALRDRLEREVDERASGPSYGRVAAPPLSPRMTAIFGAIFGLATVASILALLMRAAPPKEDRALALSSASASGSASGRAAAAGAPAADPAGGKKRVRVPLPPPWRVTDLASEKGVSVVGGSMDRRSLVDALEEKGVEKAQTFRILKAFEGQRKFDRSGRKDKFTVAFERGSKRVRGFEYEVSPSEIWQAKEDDRGFLVGSKLDLKVAEEEYAVAFTVGDDLQRAWEWSGLEPGIVQAIDEALGGTTSSEAFGPGTVVKVIAVEETILGRFSRYKRVEAVEVKPADPAGKAVRAYWFDGKETHGYFDDRAKVSSGGWRAPIPGARVTSKFNLKRMHPVLHTVMPHYGTDFGAPSGTPVYTANKGTVKFVGWGGPAGNLVLVEHPNGIETGYAHLSKFAGVKVGQKVGMHQLVGYVGSTGRSTGPHLHFSAKRGGQYFDAETLHLDGEKVLAPGDRPAFLARKAEMDKRLDALEAAPPPPKKTKPAPEPKAAPEGSAAAAPAPDAAPAGAGGVAPPPDAPDADEGDDEGAPLQGAALGGATLGSKLPEGEKKPEKKAPAEPAKKAPEPAKKDDKKAPKKPPAKR